MTGRSLIMLQESMHFWKPTGQKNLLFEFEMDASGNISGTMQSRIKRALPEKEGFFYGSPLKSITLP